MIYKNSILAILISFASFNAAAKFEISGQNKLDIYLEDVSSYKEPNSNISDSQYETSDVYMEFEPSYKLKFNDNFSLNSSWRFIALKPADLGENRIFDDHGIVIEELYANFSDDQAELYIGKFNPQFGMAWDYKINSGIWGDKAGEEYQIVAKLGLGVKAKINTADYGNHVFNISTFFNDDSRLNNAILTRRKLKSGNLGQAGNTNSLSSYVINISGDNIDINYIPLYYNISYRNIDAGNVSGAIDDEEGFSLGLGLSYEITDGIIFKPFVEYAEIDNFNSSNNKFGVEFGEQQLGKKHSYISILNTLILKDWALNYHYINKDIDTSDADSGFDMQEFSVSYNINENVKFSLGSKKQDNDNGIEFNTASAVVGFSNEF